LMLTPQITMGAFQSAIVGSMCRVWGSSSPVTTVRYGDHQH